MANLKFFKGSSVSADKLVVGAIWFNTTDRTIKVCTAISADKVPTWEAYSGLQDASWDSANKALNITRANGTTLSVSLADVASAAALETLTQNFNTLNTNFATEQEYIDTLQSEMDAVEKKAADNEAAIAKLNGAADAEGSVAKAVADAVKVEKERAEAAEKDLADAVDALEEAIGEGGNVAGQISAAITKNNTDYVDVELAKKVDTETFTQFQTNNTKAIADAKAAVIGDAAEGYNTLGKLEDKILAVEGAAKSYELKAVTTGLGANVKEAYALFDEDGTQSGAQINIYKDSSLKEVKLESQELKFTYILADGTESTVGVDVSDFLAESEFKNGLEVVDGVVNVKIDATSEGFLTVGEGGVKLAGVQKAIDDAIAVVEEEIASNEEATAQALAGLDGRVEDLESKNSTIASALQAADITTGNANGTIAVKGSDVAVKGLGSAAYTESSAYATSAQGALADSAVQTVASGSANGTIAVDGTDVAVTGLKSAAYADASAFDAAGTGAAAAAAILGTADDAATANTVYGAKAAAATALADAKTYANGLWAWEEFN